MPCCPSFKHGISCMSLAYVVTADDAWPPIRWSGVAHFSLDDQFNIDPGHWNSYNQTVYHLLLRRARLN